MLKCKCHKIDDAIIFILPVASPEEVCCGNCSGEEEIGDGGIDYVNVKTFLSHLVLPTVRVVKFAT